MTYVWVNDERNSALFELGASSLQLSHTVVAVETLDSTL